MIRCSSLIRHPPLARFLSKVHLDRLGVSENASKKEIKSAYFKRAKECHPDLYPGESSKASQYLELQESYNILMASYSPSNTSHQARRQEGSWQDADYNFAGDADSDFLKSVHRQPLSRDTIGRHVSTTLSSSSFSSSSVESVQWGLSVVMSGVIFSIGAVLAGTCVWNILTGATEQSEVDKQQLESHEFYRKLNQSKGVST